MFDKKFLKALAKQAYDKAAANDSGADNEKIESAGGIKGIEQKITEMQKVIDQMKPMQGLPGMSQTLKQLEDQIGILKQAAAAQAAVPGAAAGLSAKALERAEQQEQAKQQTADRLTQQAAQATQGLQGLLGNLFGGGGADKTSMPMHGAQEAIAQFQQLIQAGRKQAGSKQAGSKQTPAKPSPKTAANRTALGTIKPAAPVPDGKTVTVGQKGSEISFTQITGGETLKWVGGNHVAFGSYPQTADGGVEKILWRILDNKNGQLLLLSECVLEHRLWQGNTKNVPTSWKKEDIAAGITQWEECELRQWLNNGFYHNAFNAAEKNIIAERLNTGNGAHLHREYVPKKMHDMNHNRLTDDTYETYEARGCRDTRDKVFLLNAEEAIRYFPKSEPVPPTLWIWNSARRSTATDYILRRGLISDSPDYRNVKGCVLLPNEGWTWAAKGNEKLYFDYLIGGVGYWLRNIGSNNDALCGQKARYHNSHTAFVSDTGAIFAGGTMTLEAGKGVRPAILINTP